MSTLPDHVVRRLARARDRVREAPEVPHDLDALARGAGMSTWHFLRLFKQAYGTTPGRWVTTTRVERARDMLTRGASVTEACLASGFASPTSFTAAFRARFGESPREHRQRVRAFGQVPARLSAVYVPYCFLARFG